MVSPQEQNGEGIKSWGCSSEIEVPADFLLTHKKGQSLTAGAEGDENATSICPHSHSCLFNCVLQSKVKDGAKASSAHNLPAPDKLRTCSSATSTEGAVGSEGGKNQELGDLGGFKNFHWKRA